MVLVHTCVLFLSITLGLGTIASKSILSQDKNIRNEVLEASKIDIDFINEKTNEEYAAEGITLGHVGQAAALPGSQFVSIANDPLTAGS